MSGTTSSTDRSNNTDAVRQRRPLAGQKPVMDSETNLPRTRSRYLAETIRLARTLPRPVQASGSSRLLIFDNPQFHDTVRRTRPVAHPGDPARRQPAKRPAASLANAPIIRIDSARLEDVEAGSRRRTGPSLVAVPTRRETPAPSCFDHTPDELKLTEAAGPTAVVARARPESASTARFSRSIVTSTRRAQRRTSPRSWANSPFPSARNGVRFDTRSVAVLATPLHAGGVVGRRGIHLLHGSRQHVGRDHSDGERPRLGS